MPRDRCRRRAGMVLYRVKNVSRSVALPRRQTLRNGRRTGTIRLGFLTRHTCEPFRSFFSSFFYVYFHSFPYPVSNRCRGLQRGTCRNAGKTTPPLGRIYRSRADRRGRRENISIRDANVYVRQRSCDGSRSITIFCLPKILYVGIRPMRHEKRAKQNFFRFSRVRKSIHCTALDFRIDRVTVVHGNIRFSFKTRKE